MTISSWGTGYRTVTATAGSTFDGTLATCTLPCGVTVIVTTGTGTGQRPDPDGVLARAPR